MQLRTLPEVLQHLGRPPGPLTLNLSDMLSVTLMVNSAILEIRPLPLLRSGSYSVLVFTTTLSKKQKQTFGQRYGQMPSDSPAPREGVWGHSRSESPFRQEVFH